MLDFRSGLEPAAHTYLRATEFAPSLLGDLAAPCVAGLRAFGEQNRTTERAFCVIHQTAPVSVYGGSATDGMEI
jgi:hypothetical protein